jgi:CDGSH-type Zn-finger protein
MSSVTIRVRDNGPIVVEGPVTIVDAAGNVFPIKADKPAVALCRCGQSANKPFCDGSHKTCAFEAAQRAPVPGT